jgi:hypothetical protein
MSAGPHLGGRLRLRHSQSVGLWFDRSRVDAGARAPGEWSRLGAARGNGITHRVSQTDHFPNLSGQPRNGDLDPSRDSRDRASRGNH